MVGLDVRCALLAHGRWKEKGNQAYENVRDFFELNQVIDQHVEIYEGLLNGGKRHEAPFDIHGAAFTTR